MKLRIKIKIAVAAIISLASIGALHSPPRAQESTQPSRSVWDGVYTEKQAERGKTLYSQGCAACHGAEMTGGEEAPPLAGPAFLANWDGLTVGDLSERIRVSMPPNNPKSLNRQHIADILSHMLNVNGFPIGKTELDPKTELLKQIRIEATRPKG